MAFKAKTGENRHRSHTTDEAIKELTKEELKLLNVRIPAKLHKEFKMKVLENGEDMTTALTNFIERYVDRNK